jgi:hypothetical protein
MIRRQWNMRDVAQLDSEPYRPVETEIRVGRAG